MALKSTPGPEGGPDGQVLAISGSHVVLGGRKGVQNDPYNFLLPPDFIKICSKWLPWGCRWPLPSPCCSSGGHRWNPEFLGLSEPVDLPEHGESGLVFVLIFEILKLDLVAQCLSLSMDTNSKKLLGFAQDSRSENWIIVERIEKINLYLFSPKRI